MVERGARGSAGGQAFLLLLQVAMYNYNKGDLIGSERKLSKFKAS